MRNLKKVLALVLAMMMAFSLMVTVNAYDILTLDDTGVDGRYQEAVDVLVGIGVISGIDGAVAPTKTLTREEYAVILYKIVSGDTEADDPILLAEQDADPVYDDVVPVDGVNPWYNGYANYLYHNNVLSGVGNNKFGVGQTITGYEVLTGLLRAIGYGAKGEFANGWQIGAATLGNVLGISNNLPFLLSQPITREQMIQLTFNAITGPSKVTYTNATGQYLGEGDTTKYPTLGKLTLGLEEVEAKYVPELKQDAFKRPTASMAWTVNGEFLVATDLPTPWVVPSTMTVATAKTTDVPRDYNYFLSNDTTVYVNGDKDQNLTGGLNDLLTRYRADGYTIEVYDDEIIVYTTEVGTVTATTSNGKTTYSVGTGAGKATIPSSFEVADKEVIVYTKAWNGTDYTVQSIVKPTALNDKITKINETGATVVYTIGGIDYTISEDVTTPPIILNSEIGKDHVFYVIDDTIVKVDNAQTNVNYDGYGVVVAADVVPNTTSSWGTTTGGITARLRIMNATGAIEELAFDVKAVTSNVSVTVPDSKVSGNDNYYFMIDNVVHGIDLVLNNNAVDSTHLKDLLGSVYAYSKSNDKVTLSSVQAVAATNTDPVAMGTWTGTTTNVIDKNTVTKSVNGQTLLFNNDTMYYVTESTAAGDTYKSIKGAKDLALTEITNAQLLVDVSGGSTKIVKAVFAVNEHYGPDNTDAATDVLVYIDGKATISISGNDTIYTYTGVKDDGTEQVVESVNQTITPGLYVLTESGKVGNEVQSSVADGKVVTAATVDSITGNVLGYKVNNSVTYVTFDADDVVCIGDAAFEKDADIYIYTIGTAAVLVFVLP